MDPVPDRSRWRPAKDEGKPAAIWTPIDTLVPWKDNPRRNETAVAKVAESIARFGFGAPIVVRAADNQIIAGHTRLQAARQLGLREVPVRFLELSSEEARLLSLADNRLGEIAEWDEERLAAILEELKLANADVLASGFRPTEIDRLLTDLRARRLAEVVEDAIPQPPLRPTSCPGLVYQLGPHRLVCADCTEEGVLDTALAGRKADLLFTDPPYGVDYQSHMARRGTASRFRKIENDDLAPEALGQLLKLSLQRAAEALRAGASFYVFHGNQRPRLYATFEAALLSSGFHVAGCIVWVKPTATMGWQDYRNQYEPILYGWKPGAQHQKVEDRTETNVWEVRRDAAVFYDHPTQKPVELSMRAMRNSTVEGETVLDLFGGSGSTLIGAARTGRSAVLVEKDPAYCDVIRERWACFVAKVSR